MADIWCLSVCFDDTNANRLKWYSMKFWHIPLTSLYNASFTWLNLHCNANLECHSHLQREWCHYKQSVGWLHIFQVELSWESVYVSRADISLWKVKIQPRPWNYRYCQSIMLYHIIRIGSPRQNKFKQNSPRISEWRKTSNNQSVRYARCICLPFGFQTLSRHSHDNRAKNNAKRSSRCPYCEWWIAIFTLIKIGRGISKKRRPAMSAYFLNSTVPTQSSQYVSHKNNTLMGKDFFSWAGSSLKAWICRRRFSTDLLSPGRAHIQRGPMLEPAAPSIAPSSWRKAGWQGDASKVSMVTSELCLSGGGWRPVVQEGFSNQPAKPIRSGISGQI